MIFQLFHNISKLKITAAVDRTYSANLYTVPRATLYMVNRATLYTVHRATLDTGQYPRTWN